MKAYRIKGTTDDVTDCELCGKSHLKGTVVLEALDADGNPEDVVYFGRVCAGKAAGWTQREITTKLKAAKLAAKSAAREAVMAKREAENKAFAAWCTSRYSNNEIKHIGTVDLWREFRAQSALAA